MSAVGKEVGIRLAVQVVKPDIIEQSPASAIVRNARLNSTKCVVDACGWIVVVLTSQSAEVMVMDAVGPRC